MTKRQLTARQVRWLDILSRFNFEIVFTPGKKNIKADALTRRKGDHDSQRKVILESRNQVLLKLYQLDTRILAEQEATLLTAVNKDCCKDYNKNTEIELAPLEDIQAEDIGLIDRILQANRTSNTLTDLRTKAGELEDWKIENRLL